MKSRRPRERRTRLGACLALLLGCAPLSPPSASAPPASAPPPAPPTPCARAGALRAGAEAALAEGHLLRALGRAKAAAALCPGEAVAVDMVVKCEAALRDGELPAGASASTAEEADYRRAARLFLDGKRDEAAAEALRVAAAGGKLAVPALVLAGRTAALAGQAARASRMFARAAARLATSGQAPAVEPPRDDDVTLAATYPDYQSLSGSCVSTRDPSTPALTPDGRFLAVARDGTVRITTVHGRVLVDWIEIDPRDFRAVCLGAAGRVRLLLPYPDRPVGPRVDVTGGEPRPLRFPGPRNQSAEERALVVRSDGAVLFPATYGEGEVQLDWLWAGPGDRALRQLFPAALAHGQVAGVTPDGDVVGVVAEAPPHAYQFDLVRLDPMSAKVRLRAGPLPDYAPAAVTRDGRRVIVLDTKLFTTVDLASGAMKSVKRTEDGLPRGLLGGAHVLLLDRHEPHGLRTLDVDTGALEPAGAVLPAGALTVDVAGTRAVVRRDDGGVVLDLPTEGAPGLSSRTREGEIQLTREVGGELRTLRLVFARGASGGMAVDEEGFFELFGDAPPAFHAAARCGADLPLEVCAEAREAPGMTARDGWFGTRPSVDWGTTVGTEGR